MTVTQRGYFAASDLGLNSPETGELGVTVSRDRIGRFLGSETRERRQRLYADEFPAPLSSPAPPSGDGRAGPVVLALELRRASACSRCCAAASTSACER